MDNSRLSYLLERYIAEQTTPEELEEFYGIVRDADTDNEIREILARNWLSFDTKEQLPAGKADSMLSSVLQLAGELDNKPAPVVYMKSWMRIAAAAAVLFAVGAASYFLFSNHTQKQAETLSNIEVPKLIKAPEINKATITLSNGEKVPLDSVGNGRLATQGKVTIEKLSDGRIAYTGSAKEVVYNTLTNPAGSRVINMTLADGSKIWLNAGSSLTYPVAFIGGERKVSVTGEAYFEIAHNAEMPFTVAKGNIRVQVLGTHFNMNTYDDEPDIKVTLLEGLIHVTSENGNRLLKPGQQAKISTQDITVVSDVDVDAVMAWKNGFFSFKNSDLQTVMRQISRWYDVEIIYAGQIADRRFGGEISRNGNLSQVLKVLAESKVNFRVNGRKIEVLP